jgi:uncharacterized protein YutE (UPF0331/DUF86 family)
MRSIDGKITDEILNFVGGDTKLVGSSDGYPVNTFRELVVETAKLAYLNPDNLLFYRGQKTDYKNRGGNSTFYPSIYRLDYLPQREIDHRFRVLDGACKELVDHFIAEKIDGHKEVKRRELIQWSILQHYEVCNTPLLDFTHSLRVACSFALLNNNSEDAYIYVFGLPYLTNRITINSEHDLINIRLLSICPPQAFRPFFQEGYLAGTTDLKNDYENKSEFDFNNRLIAKFKIPRNLSFWGESFHKIPEDSLYPDRDPIKLICDKIKGITERGLKSGDIGDFLKLWVKLEKIITNSISIEDSRFYSFGEALKHLFRQEKIDKLTLNKLNKLRRFRNEIVHKPDEVNDSLIFENITLLESMIDFSSNLFKQS